MEHNVGKITWVSYVIIFEKKKLQSFNLTQLKSTPDQWQIQDFPQGGAPTPKIAIIFQIFAEN